MRCELWLDSEQLTSVSALGLDGFTNSPLLLGAGTSLSMDALRCRELLFCVYDTKSALEVVLFKSS